MSEHSPDPNLDTLVNKADQAVRNADEQATQTAARGAKPSQARLIATLVLVALCAVVLYVQAPRFSQPFAVPNPDTDASVVEADLDFIAQMVQVYQASQGQYPESLDQVRFPEGYAEAVDLSKLAYAPTDGGFTLDWTLPNWHATFDSQTGSTRVESLAK